MRPASDVRRVFELWDQGLPKAAIARATGVSRAQVRCWLAQGHDVVLNSRMRREAVPCDRSSQCDLVTGVNERAYAYLFGQYLGDGCISRARRELFRLRITMCDDYLVMRAECEAAICVVIPGRSVGQVQREGCTEVYCHSKHWPCLFPQHGAGRKHERPLVLGPWQERIAHDLHPDLFLRGLIHSDGCRALNTVTSKLLSGPKRYTYPRYFFKNESADIRGFFIEACRRLGIEYRYSQPTTISVARRTSVAILDSFIGPKS
jgi:hypothetical protein